MSVCQQRSIEVIKSVRIKLGGSRARGIRETMSEEQPMRERRDSTRITPSNEIWLAGVAEIVGTTLLLLLICLPSCYMTPPESLTQKAIASGLAVALLVQSLDHLSGAMFNPAVTLAAVIARHITPTRGALYFVSQVIGAVLAGGILCWTGENANGKCATLPAENTTPFKAVAIEALVTSCLALANCASWDVRNKAFKDSWPLRIGATVAGLTLAAGDLTGASMNPVRSFGPVLWSNNWDLHWVYWLGPLGGSLAGTLLYVQLWGVSHCHSSLPNPVPRIINHKKHSSI